MSRQDGLDDQGVGVGRAEHAAADGEHAASDGFRGPVLWLPVVVRVVPAALQRIPGLQGECLEGRGVLGAEVPLADLARRGPRSARPDRPPRIDRYESARAMRTLASTSGWPRKRSPRVASARSSSSPTVTDRPRFLPGAAAPKTSLAR